MRREFLFVLACAATLCGCAAAVGQPHNEGIVPPSSQFISSEEAFPASPAVSEADSAAEPEARQENYIVRLADGIAQDLLAPGMDETEKVRAAYEYVIQNTWFAPPIGLDAWRWRGDGPQPDYLEQRAISPLAFGIGSCEDYAAALTPLLCRMGFEAKYLPGLTISAGGGFVDHAWAAVRIGNVWYHLDPQLEDNVLHENRLTYRYFLKSDQYMLADHRWGENMLAFGGFNETQAALVRESYCIPACPLDAPSPVPKQIQKSPRPSQSAIEQALSSERAAYERENGPLSAIELDITPPIFGNMGYGDPNY